MQEKTEKSIIFWLLASFLSKTTRKTRDFLTSRILQKYYLKTIVSQWVICGVLYRHLTSFPYKQRGCLTSPMEYLHWRRRHLACRHFGTKRRALRWFWQLIRHKKKRLPNKIVRHPHSYDYLCSILIYGFVRQLWCIFSPRVGYRVCRPWWTWWQVYLHHSQRLLSPTQSL